MASIQKLNPRTAHTEVQQNEASVLNSDVVGLDVAVYQSKPAKEGKRPCDVRNEPSGLVLARRKPVVVEYLHEILKEELVSDLVLHCVSANDVRVPHVQGVRSCFARPSLSLDHLLQDDATLDATVVPVRLEDNLLSTGLGKPALDPDLTRRNQRDALPHRFHRILSSILARARQRVVNFEPSFHIIGVQIEQGVLEHDRPSIRQEANDRCAIFRGPRTQPSSDLSQRCQPFLRVSGGRPGCIGTHVSRGEIIGGKLINVSREIPHLVRCRAEG
jgi:hypothetical protein